MKGSNFLHQRKDLFPEKARNSRKCTLLRKGGVREKGECPPRKKGFGAVERVREKNEREDRHNLI